MLNPNLEKIPPIRPAWYYAIPLAFLILVTWFIPVTIVDIIGAVIFGPENIMGPWVGFGRIFVTVIYAWFIWVIFRYGSPFSEAGLVVRSLSPVEWLTGIVLGFLTAGIALLVIVISGGFSIGPPESTENSQVVIRFTWITMFLTITLFAAIEEILMRGIIYPFLKKSLPMAVALLVSSIFFSLMHLGNSDFGFFPFLNIVLAGIFLGLLRDLTGNLWLACGAHFGWNFLLMATGLPVSGFDVTVVGRDQVLIASGPDFVTGGGFGPEGGLSSTIALAVVSVVVVYLLKLKKKQGISRNPARKNQC